MPNFVSVNGKSRTFFYPARLVILLFLLLQGGWAAADGIGSISRSNKLITAAEEALKKKDYRSAIRSYESALRENPALPAQVRLNLAHACYQANRTEAARDHYLAAAAILSSPAQRSVAFQQIGNLFARKKDYTTALEWYRKSLLAHPGNDAARFNYELALKLSRRSESGKNQPRPQENKSGSKTKKDSPSAGQNPGQDPGQGKKPDSENGKEGENGKEKEKPGRNPGKGPQGKEQDQKPGNRQPGEDQATAGDKQKDGREETPDPEGDEDSRNRNRQSNMEDPDAVRMDRKKLQEAGLTEDQARTLLQAMRQSEVKYLQQLRLKSRKGGRARNAPRW